MSGRRERARGLLVGAFSLGLLASTTFAAEASNVDGVVVDVRCQRVSEEDAAELRVRLRLEAEVLAVGVGRLALECVDERLVGTWLRPGREARFDEESARTPSKEALYGLGARLLRGGEGSGMVEAEPSAPAAKPTASASEEKRPEPEDAAPTRGGRATLFEFGARFRTLGSVSPGAIGAGLVVLRRLDGEFGFGGETTLTVGIRLPEGFDLLALGVRGFLEWRPLPWFDVQLGPELSAFALSGASLTPSTEWSFGPGGFGRLTVSPSGGQGWAFGFGGGFVGIERRVAVDGEPNFAFPAWSFELSLGYRSRIGR